MKRYLIIIFVLLLSAVAMSQNTKKVAVMETTRMTDDVTMMQSQMVRGGLETAVANAPGYEGYDRSSFDAIMREQNFQRSGAVSDAQIRKLGEMAGVQYIIVSEATTEDGYFYIIVKMLDVETGKYGAAYDKLCSTSAVEIKMACTELGAQLFGLGQRKGELQLPEGRYVGDILDGKPHGQGVLYYKSDNSKNRVSYEGGWVNGMIEGYGKMIWKNGQKYEGNWVNDKKEGYGTSYYSDGSIEYEGSWANNNYNGNGTYYTSDAKTKYVGNFKNGEKDGYFTIYTIGLNAEVVVSSTGYYVNNQEDGTWTVYDGNGSVLFHAVYKNGVAVKYYLKN